MVLQVWSPSRTSWCIWNKISTSSMDYKVTHHLVDPCRTLYLIYSSPNFPSLIMLWVHRDICSQNLSVHSLFPLSKIFLLCPSLDKWLFITQSEGQRLLFQRCPPTLYKAAHLYLLALCLNYFLPNISTALYYLLVKVIHNGLQSHQLPIKWISPWWHHSNPCFQGVIYRMAPKVSVERLAMFRL